MTSTETLGRLRPARWSVPLLAAAAAVGTVALAREMGNGPGAMGLGLAAFVGVWALMMAAMMLPSTAPKVRSFGATAVARFAVGYLAVWTLAGMAAYPLIVRAGRLGNDSVTAATAVAVALCAGCALFQLSPVKRHCVARGQVVGRATAPLRTGLVDGVWCLASNWASMLVLLAFGLMNLVVMAAVAVFAFADLHLPRLSASSRVTAIAAVAGATLITVHPAFAAGLHHSPTMAMMG